MTVRLPWMISSFLLAVSFAQTAGDHSISAAAETASTQSTDVAFTPQSESPLDLYSDLESGQRNPDRINEALHNIIGSEQVVNLNNETISCAHTRRKKDDCVYELSQIATHSQELGRFQLLFEHTFKAGEPTDDTVTFYTEHIAEADEQTLLASLVYSKTLEVQKGFVQFPQSSRAQYFFSLAPQPLSSVFSLRRIEGQGNVDNSPHAGAFDPIAILAKEDSDAVEIDNNYYEKFLGGQAYRVGIIPHKTDIDTITIEVSLEAIGKKDVTGSPDAASAKRVTTFVLVYEERKK